MQFKPNEAQKQAILHTEGLLFLTAVPGSGKTRVLLWRTVNLIVFKKIDPQFIFLCTFTEKAALQLKEGLQNLLGLVTNGTNQTFDLSKMYIGTIHFLCIKLLQDRRFAQKSGKKKKIQPLDDLEQYFHVSNTKIWKTIIQASGLKISSENFASQEEANHNFINQYFAPIKNPQLSRYDAVTKLISDKASTNANFSYFLKNLTVPHHSNKPIGWIKTPKMAKTKTF